MKQSRKAVREGLSLTEAKTGPQHPGCVLSDPSSAKWETGSGLLQG